MVKQKKAKPKKNLGIKRLWLTLQTGNQLSTQLFRGTLDTLFAITTKQNTIIINKFELTELEYREILSVRDDLIKQQEEAQKAIEEEQAKNGSVSLPNGQKLIKDKKEDDNGKTEQSPKEPGS
jgi:hypothetical protein